MPGEKKKPRNGPFAGDRISINVNEVNAVI
jgi:hypothetical protein